MITTKKTMLLFWSLFFSLPVVRAQLPQELLDKAKAAGMTETQIQQELAKYRAQSPQQTTGTAQEIPISDRHPLSPDIAPPADRQRKEKLPKTDLSETVFGREIFSSSRLSFEPDLNIPTPKDYVISAGDELAIHVWGNYELNLRLKVSPEGTITIPDLGPVAVSGLTIEAADDYLRNELSQIMSTLAGQETGNTFVSVNLSQIRSIKVNIVGEVVAPGTYTLPSFATLFNALYAAGGVNDIGTLRNIKVYRNSRETASLDVYNYLLRGKYDTNIRLQENDMIIVGPYEELVVVRGKVKRNRIFELRTGETLAQLLEMAGGFRGDAYTRDVQVKRKTGTRYQLSTVRQNRFNTFVMHDGDSLHVDSVIPFYENRLTITGAVWRPGEYELSDSLHTVKQLVEQAAGLKGDEFAGRAQLIRLNPDFTSRVEAVDIHGILAGTVPDMPLKPEDKLHIPTLFELREPYTFKVSGAVNFKDTVLPYHHNLTVEDAIMMAGGLQESAATVHVEVARRIKNTYARESGKRIAEVYTFTLNDNLAMPDGSAPNDTLFTLQPFDEVYVRHSPGYQPQQVVRVNGEITFSGSYVLEEKDFRLSELIKKAGGITSNAYVKGASLKRKLTDDEMQRIETLLDLSSNKQSKDSILLSLRSIENYPVGIDLEKALAYPGSSNDMVLRDGDELMVPQIQTTVKVSGSVAYPNSVTYGRNMTVYDYIGQAGGYNDIARKYPIVIYMNGKVATTRRIALFFKRYPKVEPGCEIVIPAKTQRDRRASVAELMSIGSSATSMAAMITSIVNLIKK